MEHRLTILSNSDLWTALSSTCNANCWTSVRGFRSFSGSGIGSLWQDYKGCFINLAHKKGEEFLGEMAACPTHSFSIGWALTILLWASSHSVLSLSSVSLCSSSSCRTKLSSWKPSGLVQGFGSGFGGTWTWILLDKMNQKDDCNWKCW